MEKVKRKLSRYYEAKKKVAYIEKELARLERSAGDIKATDFSRVIVDGTTDKDTIGNLVARIDAKITALEKARIKARAVMLEVEDLIDTVEDTTLREVLCQRYIELKKWEDIAQYTNYSITHVQRLHEKGLADLTERAERKTDEID